MSFSISSSFSALLPITRFVLVAHDGINVESIEAEVLDVASAYSGPISDCFFSHILVTLLCQPSDSFAKLLLHLINPEGSFFIAFCPVTSEDTNTFCLKVRMLLYWVPLRNDHPLSIPNPISGPSETRVKFVCILYDRLIKASVLSEGVTTIYWIRKFSLD